MKFSVKNIDMNALKTWVKSISYNENTDLWTAYIHRDCIFQSPDYDALIVIIVGHVAKEIALLVSEALEVKDILNSKGRYQLYSDSRAVTAYILLKKFKLSTIMIAEIFSFWNKHTTALSAIKKVDNVAEIQEKYQKVIRMFTFLKS